MIPSPCKTRRRLLGGLATLPLATLWNGTTQAQTSATGIELQKLHCFELRVADVARSVAFYQDLFGMPVVSRFAGRSCLGIGDSGQFMAIRALLPGETPAITQLGYSVADFDIETLPDKLARVGINPGEVPPLEAPGINHAMTSWLRLRERSPELYFADQQGVIVQLCDARYCGGSSPVGADCEPAESVVPGFFELSEINHFTAFVNDGAAANRFYQDSFGLQVQANQGPGSPVTGIGDGYQFVMYAGPFGGGGDPMPANLHHGCFNMQGFDVDSILSTLSDYGLQDRGEQTIGPLMHYISRRMPERGGAEGGTPELYFTDPDGILMQLQDTSYCGGGGYLGNECLF